MPGETRRLQFVRRTTILCRCAISRRLRESEPAPNTILAPVAGGKISRARRSRGERRPSGLRRTSSRASRRTVRGDPLPSQPCPAEDNAHTYSTLPAVTQGKVPTPHQSVMSYQLRGAGRAGGCSDFRRLSEISVGVWRMLALPLIMSTRFRPCRAALQPCLRPPRFEGLACELSAISAITRADEGEGPRDCARGMGDSPQLSPGSHAAWRHLFCRTLSHLIPPNPASTSRNPRSAWQLPQINLCCRTTSETSSRRRRAAPALQAEAPDPQEPH